MEGKIREEAQQDQPTLEAGTQQEQQKKILKQRDLENIEKKNRSQQKEKVITKTSAIWGRTDRSKTTKKCGSDTKKTKK